MSQNKRPLGEENDSAERADDVALSVVKASHPSSALVPRRIQSNGQRVNEQLNSRWPRP